MNHLLSNHSEKLSIMKVIDDIVSKTVETAAINIKVQSLLNSTEHEISTALTTKMLNNILFSCFEILRCCIYHAHKCLNANTYWTNVGNLTLWSRINFMLG